MSIAAGRSIQIHRAKRADADGAQLRTGFLMKKLDYVLESDFRSRRRKLTDSDVVWPSTDSADELCATRFDASEHALEYMQVGRWR